PPLSFFIFFRFYDIIGFVKNKTNYFSFSTGKNLWNMLFQRVTIVVVSIFSFLDNTKNKRP
ncbi:MAG: hypothetical protein Q4E99_04895, partial [Bacillota bacterium]|nr:hypothetical protein [Bacillota bacterium]